MTRLILLATTALVACAAPDTDRAANGAPPTTPVAAPDGGAADTPGDAPARTSPPATSGVPEPAPDRPSPVLTGRVGASGTGPAPVTTLAVDGRTLVLAGPLEAELRSLAGATVAVRGTESGTRRPTLDVASYEIIEIHGARPTVGTVLTDGRLLTGTDTLMVAGLPSEFRAGQRVWIVGERSADTLRVSSVGRIGGATP